jgi:hypothetical protein
MKKFFKIAGFLFPFVILLIFLAILILPHFIPEEKVRAQLITLAEKK